MSLFVGRVVSAGSKLVETANLIASPSNRLNQRRIDLATQIVNVDLDGVAVDGFIPSVHLGLELLSRHRPVQPLEQCLENDELLHRERNLAPVPLHAAGGRIDGQGAMDQGRIAGWRVQLATPNDGGHTRGKFGQVVRLDQIVVSALVQEANAVISKATGRGHDHRDAVAPLAQVLEAIAARQLG
jgi:hypothetical protein